MKRRYVLTSRSALISSLIVACIFGCISGCRRSVDVESTTKTTTTTTTTMMETVTSATTEKETEEQSNMPATDAQTSIIQAMGDDSKFPDLLTVDPWDIPIENIIYGDDEKEFIQNCIPANYRSLMVHAGYYSSQIQIAIHGEISTMEEVEDDTYVLTVEDDSAYCSGDLWNVTYMIGGQDEQISIGDTVGVYGNFVIVDNIPLVDAVYLIREK